ncbi:MAG: cadherin-like beta sandwich domain-containing protein [Eubacteriaceae bacterium]|nr:cadherin-like beta sandwich domain-containing protein [Eubacteriaceae bacterium]
MKRKPTRILVTILCIVLTAAMLPSGAFAYDSFSTYVSTVTEITEGQTFTVTFSFSSPYGVSAINADLDYDSSMLQMVGGEVSGGFSGSVGSSIIAYTTGSYTGGAFASVTFRATSSFRPGDTAYVGLYNVTGTSEDLEDVNGYSCGVEITMASAPAWNDPGQSSYPKPEEATSVKTSDSSLSALSVEGFTLTPAFSSSVTSYSVEIPFSVENITINATANDPKAVITITGGTNLPAGETTVCRVDVTAQDGSVTTYEIRAARAATASTECSLAELKMAGYPLSPLFDRDVFKYVVIAGDSLKQADITAVPVHPMANVKVLGPSDIYPGKENVYNVVCTAEDGVTTRIYTVTVITAQNYEFFLKKSFILTSSKQIDSSQEGVVLDLSAAPVQIVPDEIFAHLASKGSGCVAVKTKNGVLRFDADSLYEDRGRDSYDLTIQLNSDHASRAAASMAKYDNFIFSTNDTVFPGTALVSLYTTFVAGQTVNVYIYDPVNDKFEYACGDITVAEGGVVSFEIDRGGEFIVSTMDTSQTEKYTAEVRRKISLMGPWGLAIAGAALVAGLLLGILLTSVIFRRKIRKLRSTVPGPESPEDPTPGGGNAPDTPEEDSADEHADEDTPEEDSSDDVRDATPEQARLMQDILISDNEDAPEDGSQTEEEITEQGDIPDQEDIPAQEDIPVPEDIYYADLSVLDGNGYVPQNDGMSSVEEMARSVWNDDAEQAEGPDMSEAAPIDPESTDSMPAPEEEPRVDLEPEERSRETEDETFDAPVPQDPVPQIDGAEAELTDVLPEETPAEETPSPTEAPPEDADKAPVEEGRSERRGFFSFRRKKTEEEKALEEFEALLDEMNRGKRS